MVALYAFYPNLNDIPFHVWQTSGSTWSGERLMGQTANRFATTTPAQRIAVAKDSLGHLNAFFTFSNNVLYRMNQNSSSAGTSWSNPTYLGTSSNAADGRLEVLYIGTNDVVYHNYQTAHNGGWSGESPLGTTSNAELELGMGLDSSGKIEVLYVGTDNNLYHNHQTTMNGGWAGESKL